MKSSFSRILLKSVVVSAAALCFVVFNTGCGGGGGGGGGDDTVDSESLVTLAGKAALPAELATASGPVANADFQVLDLARAMDDQVVAAGKTTSDGDYSVIVGQSKALVVVVNGEVRVSGLISADLDSEDGSIKKDFDGITDVACEAGVTSVVEGAVSVEEYSSQRIANLEAGAALVISRGDVDFSDPESVSRAASLVRELTNDGDQAPRE